MNLNDTDDYTIQAYAQSPYHNRYQPPMINEIPVRRNSYQLAILTSKVDHLRENAQWAMFSSVSSSISSFHPNNHATRSMYTVNDLPSQYQPGESLQRSYSQPAVRSPENDALLENATYLLDSPVHALRPAHHKSRTTLAPSNPLSNRSSFAAPDSLAESNYCPSTPPLAMTSIYRLVIIRSLASLLALASLFSTEVLQTSIYSSEHSFQSLLTFHLSASIGAFLLAIHTSRIHQTRHRWTISNVLAYDRCSQILIVLTTILTGAWVATQYFQSYTHLLLISAAISGFSSSCMIVKTFEHFLQLSTSLPTPSIKNLTTRLNIFASIYNSLCHFALTIGGTCLLAIIVFQQYRREYILIGSQPCSLLHCFTINNQEDDQTIRMTHQLSPEIIRINMTMHMNEKKQEWQTEAGRYIFFVTLLILTIISVLPQAGIEWTTSILSMSRRLSMLYYSTEESKTVSSSSHRRIARLRNYSLAMLIGFQEGYTFGSLLRFDVTCIFGIRHALEVLIIYGVSAAIASILLSFLIKRISVKTVIAWTSLLHSLAMLLLYLSRSSPKFLPISDLFQKYFLFSLLGFAIGLWSTIATHYLCDCTEFSSSSRFAQSLAVRCLGRLISYTCTIVVCQSLIFYFNTICLLVILAILALCYFCCQQMKNS